MKDTPVDLRREGGFEAMGARVARLLKNETKDFRRPIRYGLSDAAGSVFAIIDDELVKIVSGPGRATPGKDLLVCPLVIFCSDADGKEVTVTIRSEKPDLRLNDAPPARHGG